MNQFLDEEKPKESQLNTEDSGDEDEDMTDDLPKVPEESQPQADREDQLEEDEEVTQNIVQPVEPFRLDELRISVPQLRNELDDSIKCFEKLLVESYGRSRFEQGLKVVTGFEQAGGDKYLPKSETELVRTLSRDVFANNEDSARRFLYESSSYLLINSQRFEVQQPCM